MYMYAIMDTINHPKERTGQLYIVIPAYNEQDNIEQVINDWYPVIEKHNGNGQSRLIVIDDGSKDSTYEKLKQCTKTRPLLIPITKPNGGHGATVLYGYKYALKNGADYIFQTDSDGQTLPEEFEPFWKRRQKYDMVIGWRKDRQDGISRVFVTKTLKLAIRICFGVNLTDARIQVAEGVIVRNESDKENGPGRQPRTVLFVKIACRLVVLFEVRTCSYEFLAFGVAGELLEVLDETTGQISPPLVPLLRVLVRVARIENLGIHARKCSRDLEIEYRQKQ